MADAKDKPKKYAVFTPYRHPLSFEVFDGNTESDRIVKVIQKRLSDSKRSSLTKKDDEQFLLGMLSMAGLIYVGNLLELVRQNDEVTMSLEER